MTDPSASAIGGNEPKVSMQRAPRAWKPLLVFSLFTLTIIFATYGAFLRYKESIKHGVRNELDGIAELKKGQITSWMAERTGDAQTLREDPLFLAEVEHWLQRGGPPGQARTNLTGRLTTLKQVATYGYTSVSLFDVHGELRLSSQGNEEPMLGIEKGRLLDSMRRGRIEFSDLHRDNLSPEDRIEIELFAPLIVTRNGKPHTLGAVLFRINPSLFLFPLVQRWPTPSESAENILVRREGDAVIFLSELRHARNTPLAMRLPLPQQDFLAVRAAMGEEGLVEGKDYRGVPVVGVVSKVTGTSWVMISKIDKAEIYAPVDRLANWMAALMLALICAGGGITVFVRQKERKHYQRELERQVLEERLAYLSRHSNDIILLLDSAGKIVDFNDRALDAYGYSSAEFSGKSMNELLATDLTLSFSGRGRAIDEAGGALVFESMHVRRSGERFPVEASVRRIDIGGEIFFQSIIRDITERKKAEDMLRFHSEILNNLAEGVFLIRASDGVIVFANPQFERMFGYGHGELIGKDVSIVNAPGDKTPEAVAKEINGELADKGIWNRDVHNIRKDGTTFWCHVSASAFEHPQYGKVWIAVHEDITEHKALEKETHHRRQEMDELQKLHVAAQTASAIAHELNQPLLAVTSYCKAALIMLKSDKPDFGEIRNAIERSERQAHRAGRAIREMFDFLNSSEFPTEDFDLVQEIVVMLNDARKEHQLQFQSSLRLEEKIPLVRANRTHVQKALFNLLRNGIEAAANAPGVAQPFITVTVHTAEDERFAEVIVQDNGPGFGHVDAQRLFEPFFTTKTGGFGMGLSISRSLIEMNGGHLWGDPKEGPGAVFHLTIPFANGDF